ncbi:class I SAM-dependent methyltransferase [Tunturiibacter gelidiferens]|uniref:class I SAM-dependent methyltransferase n=1 Tax=Tunturiibacter gelidiferens TaxID=3069689 RepID=UPI003D9AD703
MRTAEQVGISYEYKAANHEVSHSYLKPIVDSLVKDIPAGSAVLDMGCGNGSFLSLYRDRGWILYGTDFSPTGIEVARSNYPDIDFILGNSETSAADLLNQVGLVDLIISTEVIEHLYNPKAFLRTAYDVLRPGGAMVITTPYHGYLKNLAIALTGQMDKHYTVLWDHGHIKFWSAKTLSKAISDTGFESVRFKGAGRFPYLWKSMALVCKKPHSAHLGR